MVRKPQNNLFALPDADVAHILRLAEGDLAVLRGRRIFLTGGTGFFGKWLLGAFARADAEFGLDLRVAVLSRTPEKFLALYPEAADVPVFRFVTGHDRNFPPTREHFDYVLHAATETLTVITPGQQEARALDIAAGTRHALEFARRCGAARLVYFSSGGVYGAAAGKLAGASEDDYAAAAPVTPYARGKREAERLCAASGLDYVTVRGFAFLGPHLALDAHYAAGNFLRDASEGGPILVRGDGTALRSYLHPADFVVWLLRIMVRGRSGCAYNVGSDEAVTTAQLAREIAAACDPAPEVIVQSLQPQGPQNIYLPDVHRARAELGLDVAIPRRDAIARTLAFLKQ